MAKDLLEEITKIVISQQAKSQEILKAIERELATENIFIVDESQVVDAHEKFIKDYFIRKVNPELTVIILNNLREFPVLKDTAAYLAVRMALRKESNGFLRKRSDIQYALIEIPKGVDRFVVLPEVDGKNYIMILDDLIRYCLDSIFTMFDYTEISAHMIKITRDAELDIDNDLSKSFIQKISSSVEHRKISNPVRFVYDKRIKIDTLRYLREKMGIGETDSIIPGGRYHNRRDYMGFPSLGRTDLLYEKITASTGKGP